MLHPKLDYCNSLYYSQTIFNTSNIPSHVPLSGPQSPPISTLLLNLYTFTLA